MKIKGIPVGTTMKPILKKGTGQDSVEQVNSDEWNGTGNNPNPQATAKQAVALGRYTQATGGRSMAVNYNTKAIGEKSFAANSSNETKGIYSASFGHTNVVEESAPAGFAQGIGNKVVKQAQMVGGLFATPDDSAMFVVGDGSSDTSRSTAFAVYPKKSGEGASLKLGDNLLTHSLLSQMIHHIKNPQLERYSMGGSQTYNLVHINDIGNTVSGSRSVALGAGHEVKASYAVALNRHNEVTADNAFAANDNNKATNIHATAFGYENESSGICSFALGGNKNKVSGANSVVTGHMNIASGNEQFVAGVYNAEDPDAAFIVGNGANGVRSNAFVVKKDGSILVNGKRLDFRNVGAAPAGYIDNTVGDGEWLFGVFGDDKGVEDFLDQHLASMGNGKMKFTAFEVTGFDTGTIPTGKYIAQLYKISDQSAKVWVKGWYTTSSYELSSTKAQGTWGEWYKQGGGYIDVPAHVPVIGTLAELESLVIETLKKMECPGVHMQVVVSDLYTCGVGLLTIASAMGMDSAHEATVQLQARDMLILGNAIDDSLEGDWFTGRWYQVATTEITD